MHRRLSCFVPALAASAVLLAGCASTPSDATATVASAEPDAPAVKCRTREAGIGTSIPRKDCSSINRVNTVDPQAVMDTMRTTPNR